MGVLNIGVFVWIIYMTPPLVIHISGASGSGKTTLGNKLKSLFRNRIIVKDLDELRAEFIQQRYGSNYDYKSFDAPGYQSFLDNYISSQKKPLVLTGLNNMFWWHKDLYYGLSSNHNFYIDLDDMVVVQQKCIRFITDEMKDMVTKNPDIIRDITENNKKFVRLMKQNIEQNCGSKETLKINRMWKKAYTKQGYQLIPREEIYKKVVNILQKQIKSKTKRNTSKATKTRKRP